MKFNLICEKKEEIFLIRLKELIHQPDKFTIFLASISFNNQIN